MFRKIVLLTFLTLFLSIALVACGPGDTVDDTEPDAEAISPKHGGVLRNAYHAPANLDPAKLGTITDGHIGRQWSDFLVFIGEDNEPDINRSVAENWESDESGTAWTFNLRQGILFHDGKEMTARDVKFTFDRLRDPDVGAATVDLYSNIIEITTPDDYTAVFHLENPNPDFLKDLADYHALIMDVDNEDFDTNWNGTGPFMITSYSPEDRIVFVRNPNYWMTDEDGYPLPYLDGMEFLFLDEPSAQVEALRGGQVDYLIYLPVEFASILEDDPGITVYSEPSNSTYVIRMRADMAPTDDVRVRQALKLATNRSAILEVAQEGLGVAGRDTPIGPSYTEFYLDVPEPQRDVEKARELLTEAGYPDGFEMTLHAMTLSPVPAIATIWKEQLADIGVEVDIQLSPAEVYYENWLEVQLGITDWAARPYPQPYLDLAYRCGAPWNETHWCDEEHDQLAAAASMEMDPDERIRLYHEIQEIFMERGPIIIPFFVDNLWGARTELKGIKPTSALGFALDLRTVYFEE